MQLCARVTSGCRVRPQQGIAVPSAVAVLSARTEYHRTVVKELTAGTILKVVYLAEILVGAARFMPKGRYLLAFENAIINRSAPSPHAPIAKFSREQTRRVFSRV